MSPRSLFIIILRVLGLFFIKDMLVAVPQLLSTFYFLSESMSSEAVWTFIISVLTFTLYFLVVYYLLFRTNAIIDRLKLAEQFDEPELNVQLSMASVLHIALIVAGAVILTNEIPALSQTIYFYYQQSRSIAMEGSGPDYTHLVVNIIKLVIGALLIGERRRIVAFVLDRQKDQA